MIPLFTTLALDDRPLPLYASVGHQREWLHVEDHCRAIAAVIERGRVGETYHVGSGEEATIEEVADGVLAALGKPASLKEVVPDRPGHDRRYLLDSSRIARRAGVDADDLLGAGPGRHGGLVRGAAGLVGAPGGAGPGGRDGLGLRHGRS